MYRIEREIKESAKKIDEALCERLSECEIGIGKLADAMRYSVQNGGKRLRAFLTQEVCRMFGGDEENALSYALAIEFGHAASLIHDDMPCMDNDELRRGKPSCHVFFDEYTALLAGDALLSLAFETIITNPNVDAQTNLLAAKAFSHNVGANGMCLGQQKDLDGICSTYQDLSEIYELKTGLAIKISMVLGCLAAGKTIDNELQKKIDAYSLKVGMAYQIIDDLLDAYGTVEQIGKPIGSDIRNQKVTVLSFLPKEEAERMATSLLDDAAALFVEVPSSELICELPHYLKKRMGVQIGELTLGAKALSCFEQVDPSQRYDFTKEIMEAPDTIEVSNVLHRYDCADDEKTLVELTDFLQHSKYVEYRKYKDANKRLLYPLQTNKEVISLQNADQKIVVVGAGAAGTTCAFLLKQAGYDVVLLERASLARKSKLCGGILSDKSVNLLTYIYGDEIRAVFKQNMDDVCFCLDEGSRIDAKKSGYYTAVRKTLDDYFLKRYMELGGAVIDQIDIRELDTVSHTIKGINRESGEQTCCAYDILIAADGANSIIRKSLTGKSQGTMLALEIEVPPKGNTFIMSPGAIRSEYYGYCWYIPQGDKANIGCGYAKKTDGKYWAADAKDMQQKLSQFAEQIGIDINHLPIKGAMLPCAEVLLKSGDVHFIGDAAGLINAHTGEGIHYALASALLLKNAIVQGFDYEAVMRSITKEISLGDASREEFYDILAMLIEG